MCFSHQIEPHTSKISFSIVLKHFRDTEKTCHFGQKSVFLIKLSHISATLSFSAVMKCF